MLVNEAINTVVAALRAQGLSNGDLAKQTGYNLRTIQRLMYADRKHRPTVDLLFDMASFAGVDFILVKNEKAARGRVITDSSNCASRPSFVYDQVLGRILNVLAREDACLSASDVHRLAEFFNHPNIDGVRRRLRNLERFKLVEARKFENCLKWRITPAGVQMLQETPSK